MGESFRDPSGDVIDLVLGELDGPDDPEHPDVSLTHESEWCLSAFSSGLLLWENVGDVDSDTGILDAVTRTEVKRLWLALARGEIDVVSSRPWRFD